MLTLLTRLHHTRLRFPQIPPHQICCSYTLPHSPSLYLILTLFKRKFSLSWLFLYLSLSLSSLHLPNTSLHLPNIFICSINYLTFSSTSFFNSPLELPDLFISPINCTPNFLFKSYARIFYLSPCGPYGSIVFLVSKVCSFPFDLFVLASRFKYLLID